MVPHPRPPALAPARAPAALTAALTGLLTGLLVAVSAPPSAAAEDTALYLVTLSDVPVPARDDASAERRARLLARQDDTLAAVGAGRPVYRWTTALSGYAAELTEEQASDLALRSDVALVEENSVRPLASAPLAVPAVTPGTASRSRGGAGTVIGVIDSGLWPESPTFAAVPGLGRDPEGFAGQCVEGEGWDSATCNRKVVGSRWFVAGFGTDNLRSSSTLSARDEHGHGTQVASVAAGNAGVSVQVDGEAFGAFGGVAPQARLAVYKACWTAPDPADDGCATADLVTAVDRATADGVDVLNLSVGGQAGLDTLQRALLGAAEADIVVAAAAGNNRDAYAGHPSPWVTTVGATLGRQRRGEVLLPDGSRLRGAMSSSRQVGPARIVRGRDVAAPGSRPAEAAGCARGSLDAAEVAGAVVICERGEVGRVDTSSAVELADGIGMVLVNRGPGAAVADIHAVPTVHLPREAADELTAAVAADSGLVVTLRPAGTSRRTRVPSWSATGDPRGGLVKPDVVAPGAGILGAVPPATRSGRRWDLFSGTSAAAAHLSGEAAVLRSREPGWSAPTVRSALTTSAGSARRSAALAQGAGRARVERAARPGLVYDVGPRAYRRYLQGDLGPEEINTPSIMLDHNRATVTRRVTNVGKRAMYYSARVSGLSRHRVSVTPEAIRIGPGESRDFTVRVVGGSGDRQLDSGWIAWRGANGNRVRIPLVVSP
ncbi:S8 family serine peptidase [Nocardioides sp.]|uniref:S8 family serine peptidase n=1 Tax=Nocardioides sp. TaxID=35761 RepID=UPI002732E923|nr:S8 family serine peptidase [Nocardioides sp.]MDP3892099.1 S8 family serine peptidase [Nocardioides sp.]